MKFKTVLIKENFENYRIDIENFCKKAEYETKSVKTKNNMIFTDWDKYPESLLYRIFISKKYDNGNGAMSLIYDDEDKLCMFAGVEGHNKDIAIMAKRFYVLKKYRKKGTYLSNYILPEQIKWAKEKKYKICLITINKYQTGVLELFKRLKSNNVSLIGETKTNIKNQYLYKQMELLPNEIYINNELQHIIVYTLSDCDYKQILKGI